MSGAVTPVLPLGDNFVAQASEPKNLDVEDALSPIQQSQNNAMHLRDRL